MSHKADQSETETVLRSKEAEHMYLNFIVGKEVYGIGVSHVLQIVAMQEINEMPEMPPRMKGFIHLRGNVVPVFSMHALFNKAEPEYTERTCMVVITADDGQIGLIVDSIQEAVTIEPENILPPPQMDAAGMKKPYVKGIAQLSGGRTVVLLEASHLFD